MATPTAPGLMHFVHLAVRAVAVKRTGAVGWVLFLSGVVIDVLDNCFWSHSPWS